MKFFILFALLLLACNDTEQQKVDNSINGVVYNYLRSGYYWSEDSIAIIKTASGANAIYKKKSKDYYESQKGHSIKKRVSGTESFEAKFNTEEWQAFLTDLQECRINEWEEEYNGEHKSSGIRSSNHIWNLDISYSDRDVDAFSGLNKYPQNWDEFAAVMDKIKNRIIAKTENKAESTIETGLAEKYEKKFGEPASDFELSTKEVSFRKGKSNENSSIVSIARTDSGATVIYDDHNYSNDRKKLYRLKLSHDEWLDFIRSLRKVRTDKWQKDELKEDDCDKPAVLPRTCRSYEKDYVEDKSAIMKWLYEKFPYLMQNENWMLTIVDSDVYKSTVFTNKNKKPANWKEFKKIIDNITAKALKLKEEMENEMKAEYQKKFGEPISGPELLTRSVELHIEDIGMGVRRTATGAFVMSEDEMELTLGEWLEIVRALHKFTDEWGEYRYKKDVLPHKWAVHVYILGNNNDESEISFGGNTYPPNYAEYKKMVTDLAKKIKRAPYVEIENKLEAAYKEKFGEDISEFELSLREIMLDTYGRIYVGREEPDREAGYAGYYLATKNYTNTNIEITLDEWLDFIRQLRKLRIDEWSPKYRVGEADTKEGNKRWDVFIKTSGMKFNTNCMDCNERLAGYYDADPPPNWNEFKTLMETIKKKAISAQQK